MAAFGFLEAYIVNGTELADPRFTIQGIQDVTPELRGDNLVPAMDHGGRWRRKRLGGRSEDWTLWVTDAKSDGSYYADEYAKRAQFNTNLDDLLGLLYTNHAATGYDAPLQVVRRIKETPASDISTYRVNYGETAGRMSIPSHAEFNQTSFTVKIAYTDARWYECNSSGTKTTSTLTASGDPGGTAITTRMTITLSNSSGSDITNPWIENTTTGSKLTFNGTLADGTSLVFDTTDFTAANDGTAATGSVDRTGSSTIDWFELRPGVSNTLTKKTGVTFSVAYTKAYI
jgi:hypothetical protein